MKSHKLKHKLCHCSDVKTNHSRKSIREEQASVNGHGKEPSGNLRHFSTSYRPQTVHMSIEEYKKEHDNILHPKGPNLDHMYSTNSFESSTYPTIKSEGRGNLYYSNRIIFPFFFILLFTGFGTVILVYTFTLERALPKKFIMAASISLVLILALWGIFRILEYCLWRKSMGRWHDTPEAAAEIPYNGQTHLNHWKKVQVNTCNDKRGCYRKTRSPMASHKSEINLSRESMRRRGAGKFWLSKIDSLYIVNKLSVAHEAAHHVKDLAPPIISNKSNTVSKAALQEKQINQLLLFIFVISYSWMKGICTGKRPTFSIYMANFHKVIQSSYLTRSALEYSTDETQHKYSALLRVMIKKEQYPRKYHIPAKFFYLRLGVTNLRSNWYYQKLLLSATSLDQNLSKKKVESIKNSI